MLTKICKDLFFTFFVLSLILFIEGDYMFTDTHCHISIVDYDNIESTIIKAKEYGIEKFINNGSNAKTNMEVLAL